MSLALVFPGQGSQSLGMLAELSAHYPLIAKRFAEAEAVLGFDLWEVVQQGPLDRLNQTAVTQPALWVVGVCLWEIWQERHGVVPELLAGHSLGEYTALVAANVLKFIDAVGLVAKRGQYMQEAVPLGAGAMAAIVGLEDQEVWAICQQAIGDTQEVLAPANYNSPGQTVVAGHTEAVLRAIDLALQVGAKLAKQLPVSVPAHCLLMQAAAGRLASTLDTLTLTPPRIPVLQNVDVKSYADCGQIKDALVRQLYHPVRWVETIQSFKAQGIDTIIEAGFGRVLTGLNKRIDRSLTTYPIYDVSTLAEALRLTEKGNS
jgi:[acyl-carrier-protein] S-malonyltransferase